MFLLIKITASKTAVELGDFNTSHVSINPAGGITASRREEDFNTSHVSINRRDPGHQRRCRPISIHLMFLLIGQRRNGSARPFRNFNTSHVSINLNMPSSAYNYDGNFNTSHVSINPVRKIVYKNGKLFQYISCFY